MNGRLNSLISKKAAILVSVYSLLLICLLAGGVVFSRDISLKICNGWQPAYLNNFFQPANVLSANMLNEKLVGFFVGAWFFYLALGVFIIAGIFYEGSFGFKLKAKKISRTNILFGCSLALFLVAMLFNPTRNVIFVLPLALLAIFTVYLDENCGFYRFIERIVAFISSSSKIKFIGLAILLLLFFYKFPPWDFGKIIFQDDYPVIYWASTKGLEILKQGGIFGWESSMLGGYYNVSDVNNNLSLFFLPLFFLDTKVAYHLIIMASFISLPYLAARLVEIKAGKSVSNFALLIAIFITFGFFNNILFNGMVNSLIGIAFFLLNWILVERLKRGERYSISILGLSLGLTFYAHISFFLYSVLMVYVLILISRKKTLFRSLLLSTAVAFLVTLPYGYYFFVFPEYFIVSNAQFSPTDMGLANSLKIQAANILNFLKPWHFDVRDYAYRGIYLTQLTPICSMSRLKEIPLYCVKGSQVNTPICIYSHCLFTSPFPEREK